MHKSKFKTNFRYVIEDYGIKAQPSTVKNPQANSILERVHQVLADMLRCKDVSKLSLESSDPWSQLLSSVAWAIRSTTHTTLGATPAQVVFGRDMVHPIKYVVDWDLIKKRKVTRIEQSNAQENKKRIKFDYKVGTKVLIINTDIQRKLECPTEGSFEITQIHPPSGNITIKKGALDHRINIRRVKPFFPPE